MDRLKVLMVADYPVGSETIDGGVQAVSSYIVNGLMESDAVDVTVVSFRSDIQEVKVIRQNRGVIYLLPRARLGNISFYHRDFRNFMDIVKQIGPDVIHAQGAAVEGYLVVRSKYPSVVTFHGIIGEDAKFKSGLVERLRFKLISMIAERYCVKNGKNSILISPYVKRYYGDRLTGGYRFIANPIRKEFYNLVRSEQPGYILYAGKIIRRKGVVDLIDSIALIDKALDFKLFLAGALDDPIYVSEIHNKIKKYQLEERVVFLGLLNEQQVLSAFSNASILVLPSYQETAPMVIQQAMASRVPVVATSICGVPDQLENGKAGLLFCPGDVGTCAKHIERLLADTSFRESLTERAHAKAINEFHVDRVVAQTIDYYRQIARGEQ